MVPDLRLAICRRCREPERRARGAAEAEELRAAALGGAGGVHVRLSQCLNCCDGGHTLRVELRGAEVCLIGVRTVDELRQLLPDLQRIATLDIPERWRPRVFQIWREGRLRWHPSFAADLGVASEPPAQVGGGDRPDADDG